MPKKRGTVTGKVATTPTPTSKPVEPTTRERTPDELRRDVEPIIKAFQNDIKKHASATEEDAKILYVLPLLRALGWDQTGLQHLRAEVTTDGGGRTDLVVSLGPDRRPSFLVEVKAIRESLDGERKFGLGTRTFAEQAVNDAWQMRIDFAVLTNFEETRLYYTHVKKPEDGLIFSIPYHRMLDSPFFENLQKISNWNVAKGSLQALQTTRTRKEVNAEILENLFEIRQLLAESVREAHKELDLEKIRAGVQRIIDRLIIIRTAEDRGTIPRETILRIFETWRYVRLAPERRTFFNELSDYFRDFDMKYNSAIFEQHFLEDWKISNSIWEDVLRILYDYNFDRISADVLGSVYEDFIGHVLVEKKSGKITRTKDVQIQQAGGIYYTPTYIVDYVVQKTLGQRLSAAESQFTALIRKADEASLRAARAIIDDVRSWRILDPACGSGSFLIKCFDFLSRFFARFNKELIDLQRPAALVHLVEDYEREILTNQLFGVDLDEQAAEIAGVNLVLKALRPNRRLPLILDRNVVSRNSLLFGDEETLRKRLGEDFRRFRPVNWEQDFPDAMKSGGFDFVVGNPPWGATMDYKGAVEAAFTETAKGQYDIWDLFVELSRFILKPNGRWGFVLPATFFQPEHENVRRFLLKNNTIDTVVQCGEKFFPNINMATCLLIFERGK